MSLLLLMFFEIAFICRRRADPNGVPHLLHGERSNSLNLCDSLSQLITAVSMEIIEVLYIITIAVFL